MDDVDQVDDAEAYEEALEAIADMEWTVSIAGDTWTEQSFGDVTEIAARIQARKPVFGHNDEVIRVIVAPQDVRMLAEFPAGLSPRAREFVRAQFGLETSQHFQALLATDLDGANEL